MLKKPQENQIVKLFQGTKKSKGLTSARSIAEATGFPRRQVMDVLKSRSLKWYSEGSYR